ncbi:hypothetical protein AXX17_AT1G27810 [Arabidopsis thaliana]|uniref:Transmembrane protein n=1 Tax=Arabidopsis thaliana TaxID=3702 RepID=A0A178W5K0_ARATH|nr:hypothetical protein AXX17_AT1G27810 [Arabidopsis thaliana]
MVCSRRQRVYVSMVLHLFPSGLLGLIAAITINPIKVRLKKLFSRQSQKCQRLMGGLGKLLT